MTRELESPTIEIVFDAPWIVIRFLVPGSKFGPVHVKLTCHEARLLADYLGITADAISGGAR